MLDDEGFPPLFGVILEGLLGLVDCGFFEPEVILPLFFDAVNFFPEFLIIDEGVLFVIVDGVVDVIFDVFDGVVVVVLDVFDGVVVVVGVFEGVVVFDVPEVPDVVEGVF